MTEPDSIVTIDCQYRSPLQAASYLIMEGDRAAFVDNNTVHAIPLLMKALQENGFAPEQVDYAIVTHIHLDHAGGTAELVKNCPNATVLAHPKAAPHLIDPTRLVASATRVFGAETFKKLYGVLEPIPEKRVRIMDDEETLQFGGRILRFFYTRGHCNHHFCIADSGTNSIFVGDMLGLAYPPLQCGAKPYHAVVCPPPEFDPQAWRDTVKTILDAKPDRCYNTHFGVTTNIEPAAEQLLQSIDKTETVVDEVASNELDGDELTKFCEEKVTEIIENQLNDAGVEITDEVDYYAKLEAPLNTQGIAHLGKKRRPTEV